MHSKVADSGDSDQHRARKRGDTGKQEKKQQAADHLAVIGVTFQMTKDVEQTSKSLRALVRMIADENNLRYDKGSKDVNVDEDSADDNQIGDDDEEETRRPSTSVDSEVMSMHDLLPAERQVYYRYAGSLTTPTCDEVVTWTVMAAPVYITEEQMKILRTVRNLDSLPLHNFRPTQPLYGRTVLLISQNCDARSAHDSADTDKSRRKVSGAPSMRTNAIVICVVILASIMRFF